MTLIQRKNLSPKPERDLVKENNFPALQRMYQSGTRFPLILPKAVDVVHHRPLHLPVDHPTPIPLPASVLRDMCPRDVEMKAGVAEASAVARIKAEVVEVEVPAEDGLTQVEGVVIAITEVETTEDMDRRTIDRLAEVTTRVPSLEEDLTLDRGLVHVTAATHEDHLHITKTLDVTE